MNYGRFNKNLNKLHKKRICEHLLNSKIGFCNRIGLKCVGFFMLYIHLRQNVSYIFRTFYRFINFFCTFYISTIILVKSHNAVQINNKSKQKRSWKDHKLILMIVCVSNRKFLHWALILKSLYVILKISI